MLQHHSKNVKYAALTTITEELPKTFALLKPEDIKKNTWHKDTIPQRIE